MRDLVPGRHHANFGLAFGLLLLAWGIGSVLGAAFQCNLPSPWRRDSDQCFNIVRLTMAHLE